MNRATEIIDFLSKPENPDSLILAPMAPPVSRSDGKIGVAIPTVFDAQDVNDTLTTFRARALAVSPDAKIGMSGSFSFGVRDVGRFRINYATQRGSRIVSIIRIPHDIPTVEALCEDSTVVERARSILESGGPGLMTICGPGTINNALFSYALIQWVNQSLNRVLCVVEPSLTFLVKHEQSIVMQCELNTDVPNLEVGVDVATLFEPDIIYIADIKPRTVLPAVTHAMENGVMLVLSSVMLDHKALCERYCAPTGADGYSSGIKTSSFVVRQGAAGKLSVTFSETTPEV